MLSGKPKLTRKSAVSPSIRLAAVSGILRPSATAATAIATHTSVARPIAGTAERLRSRGNSRVRSSDNSKQQQQQQEQQLPNYEISNLYAASPSMKDKYSQKGGVINHPARIQISGPPGSCKTHLATNLIYSHFVPNTISVYAKNLDQDMFVGLRKYVTVKLQQAGIDEDDLDHYLHMSNEIDRTVKDYDPSQQHVVLFDDLAQASDKKNSAKIVEYLKAGRPQNISVIVIGHGFYDTAKEVRECLTHYIAFKPFNPRDLIDLHKFYASDITRPQFEAIMQSATAPVEGEDKFDKFLFIDANEPKPSKKYRKALRPDTLFDSEGRMIAKPAPLKVRTWKVDEEGNMRSPHGDLPTSSGAVDKKQHKEEEHEKEEVGSTVIQKKTMTTMKRKAMPVNTKLNEKRLGKMKIK